jgi:diguanylate cyclase (GGDEF)-like protein/PAS domain S-box-containing protein
MPEIAGIDLFRSVLESLHTAVYIVDHDGKILFWNEGAERITGYLRQNVIGRNFSSNFLGECDADENELSGALAPIAIAIREGKQVGMQVSLRHKTGHRIPVQLWTTPIRDDHGLVVAAAETFDEAIAVSEWDRRQPKLAAYGCLDQVSGVLTHGMIQARLRENVGTFSQHPIPFSILCMEIDNWEQIQARDGPAAIASILRTVGHTLENSLRPTDFLGRWQDNQFLALLNECNDAEIGRAAERLKRTVSTSKIEWWGDPLPVTMSVGGSTVQTGDTAESLVLRAEEALNESKTYGGNSVTISR